MSYVDFDLYLNDEIPLRIPTGITLTGATVTKIYVQKPDETEVEWIASIDGNDATYMYYHTASGDLDQDGDYAYNTYVEKGTLKKTGKTRTFTVKRRGDR